MHYSPSVRSRWLDISCARNRTVIIKNYNKNYIKLYNKVETDSCNIRYVLNCTSLHQGFIKDSKYLVIEIENEYSTDYLKYVAMGQFLVRLHKSRSVEAS